MADRVTVTELALAAAYVAAGEIPFPIRTVLLRKGAECEGDGDRAKGSGGGRRTRAGSGR